MGKRASGLLPKRGVVKARIFRLILRGVLSLASGGAAGRAKKKSMAQIRFSRSIQSHHAGDAVVEYCDTIREAMNSSKDETD